MKISSTLRFLAGVIIAVFCVGCAGDKTGKAANTTPPAHDAGKTAKTGPANAQALAPRSTFTIDETSRDPFFPQVRKAAASTANAAPQQPVDVSSLLSAGFQGIGGTGDRRIAVINNVLLEAGQPAVIPLQIGNQSRSLAVKCREVARNSVLLDVEGYGRLLVTRKETL